MYNEILGDMVFNNGYSKDITLNIFNRLSSIHINFMAYYDNDGVSKEQEESYINFIENVSQIIEKVEVGILEKFGCAEDRFSIRSILIDRQGELAFLFDDKEDEDDGIAVQVYPTYLIDSQDNYL